MLMQTRQVKNSKSLQLNFYVALQPETRSSRSKSFFKIGVLKSFAKFRGIHLCQSFFFEKLKASGPQLYQKNKQTVNSAKSLIRPFFLEHHPWHLLCNSTEYE